MHVMEVLYERLGVRGRGVVVSCLHIVDNKAEPPATATESCGDRYDTTQICSDRWENTQLVPQCSQMGNAHCEFTHLFYSSITVDLDLGMPTSGSDQRSQTLSQGKDRLENILGTYGTMRSLIRVDVYLPKPQSQMQVLPPSGIVRSISFTINCTISP
jgi:hypothetical protein